MAAHNGPVFLSVLIPAVYEGDILAEALRRVQAYAHAKGIVCEAVATKIALHESLSDVHGRYVLIADARMRTPIKEVDKLIHVLEKGADVAVGSLGRRGFVERLLARLCGHGTKDRLGFVCFRRDSAPHLFTHRRDEGPQSVTTMLKIASRRGVVREVPVMWR